MVRLWETIINALRGIYVCVPRNMTQAAGMLNTLLQANDPALIIEPLNGYRTKERLPSNFGEFTVPLGVPEITKEGEDVTLVSYGSTFNLCSAALERLEEEDISVELIDAQTLLPFDIHGVIKSSIQKTSKFLIVDEDVSSGASAFILDQVLVKQGAFNFLDQEPQTLSAKDHRPAYSTDGDYFSKPSISDIVEKVYAMMNDSDPSAFSSYLMETFKIEGEYIQLIQLLKAASFCSSGGEAKMMVDEGLVLVNGEVELQKRKKLRPGDEVELEGNKVQIS